MLPPTRTTAPTSDSAEPTAAIARRQEPDPRLAQRERRHLHPAGAERARLVEQARRHGLDRRGGERDDDRQREQRLRDEDALDGEEQVHRPSGASGNISSASTSPTTTGGRPSPALASDERDPRPRNRPSPSASPIGSPSTSAIAVETSATFSVTQMTCGRYGSPWTIRSTTPADPCQKKLHLGRRPVT